MVTRQRKTDHVNVVIHAVLAVSVSDQKIYESTIILTVSALSSVVEVQY